MFDDDSAALAPDVVPEEDDRKGLLVAQSERGICRVVTDPVEAAELDVLVPFWAVWPFESLVLPRTHAGALPELGPDRRDGLADILRRLTRRYSSTSHWPLLGSSAPG